MQHRITQGYVNGLIAGATDQIIWDTILSGFGVKVTPRGRKTYFVYYRTASGQQRRPAIGSSPDLTAEDARKIAKKWLGAAATGEDVSGDRKAGRQAASVRELANRYLREHAALHKKASSALTDKSNIENHVLPALGSMKVGDVRPADIIKLQRAVASMEKPRKVAGAKPRGRRIIRGGSGVANRVLALASKMFACAINWGLRTDNPVRGIQRYKENKRERFLDRDEVQRLHAALEAADNAQKLNPFPVAAIRLLLFTGLRRSEVTNLKWRAVNLRNGQLVLEDTKTGRRVLPIGEQAIAVLSGLPRGAPNDLVIQSSVKGAPIALARPWADIRAAAGLGPEVTLHILRHTFGSYAVMGGLSLAETGALLGHRSAQTTLRYAHHDQASIRKNANRIGEAIAAMRRA